jgi:uncharacterized LabA/DUF88 family protein
VRLPVSQEVKVFDQTDNWLLQLSRKDMFAVRRGVLKFRGWKPRTVPVPPQPPTDNDFEPVFEQKGVDMRIGLDVAAFSENKAVERVILISNDTDCVPAMKYARRAGLQTVTIKLPDASVASELQYHSDFVRSIDWP